MDKKIILLVTFCWIVQCTKTYDYFPLCGSSQVISDTVQFCQNSKATAQTIFIVSGAPKYQVTNSCRCDVALDSDFTNMSASYKISPHYVDCDVKVWTNNSTHEFTCTPEDTLWQGSVARIYFSKRQHRHSQVASDTMCLQISLASESASNISVQCYAQYYISTTTDGRTAASNTHSSLYTPTQSTEGHESPESLPSGSSNVESSSRVTGLINQTDSQAFTTGMPSTSDTAASVIPIPSGDESQRKTYMIMATTAGGGGACLLIVCVVLIVCCCRKRKTNTDLPKKAAYNNATTDYEVTDNVMYNMEFPDETKFTEVNPNDRNGIYTYIASDTKHHMKETTIPVTYNNLLLDGDRDAHTVAKFDTEPQVIVSTTQADYNNAQICDDGRAYDTIVDGTTTTMQN